MCYKAPEWPWEAILGHDLVLVEIASAVSTARRAAEDYNRRRWAIGNCLMIGRLMLFAELEGILDRVLVSPATDWTLGHPEEVRETVAGCTGQDNHDIRACRCMLHYHDTNPRKWRPVAAYYRGLGKKRNRP